MTDREMLATVQVVLVTTVARTAAENLLAG